MTEERKRREEELAKFNRMWMKATTDTERMDIIRYHHPDRPKALEQETPTNDASPSENTSRQEEIVVEVLESKDDKCVEAIERTRDDKRKTIEQAEPSPRSAKRARTQASKILQEPVTAPATVVDSEEEAAKKTKSSKKKNNNEKNIIKPCLPAPSTKTIVASTKDQQDFEGEELRTEGDKPKIEGDKAKIEGATIHAKAKGYKKKRFKRERHRKWRKLVTGCAKISSRV